MFNHTTIVGAVCAMPLLFIGAARAREDGDIGSLSDKGLAAMYAEKWGEALVFNTRAVEGYGKNKPMHSMDAKFGVIYYRKGLCELKLRKFSEAMASFEICYNDFPNAGNAGGNQYNKLALLKWGEAAMGAEQWELAMTQFQKFIKERDKSRDAYPEGIFHVNMAICHYRLGRIPEGNQSLEIAIKNREGFNTPDAAIVAGFQALVTGAIVRKNEQALLDFIEKNRGDIVIDPYAMQNFNSVFMKLADEAIGVEMERAAFAIYQMIPSTEVAIQDLRVRLKSIGELNIVEDGTHILSKKALEEDLKDLEMESRRNKTAEMVKLGAVAYLHEKNGNIRGAYSAYLQLELYYSECAKREDNLYHLVRTASLIAPSEETRRWAGLFVKIFPRSEHIPAVLRMMLTSLFEHGEYEFCLEAAESMLPTLKEGTAEHDFCLHVLGGSYFFTGQFGKAQPLLDQHVEKYPNSTFVVAATYYQASNNTRLQLWSKGACLLDAFLAKYPTTEKNPFLTFALYDRAICHHSEGQAKEALAILAKLIDGFPEAVVLDQAYNLRGDIEQSLNNRDAAEQAYIKGLELASTRHNDAVAGECLSSLTDLKAWAAHMGDIRSSASSMKRWMEILWDRNKISKDENVVSDRQRAYLLGAGYIQQTAPFKDKMTGDDLALWMEVENLVKSYEGNPGIKTMGLLKREKEARK